MDILKTINNAINNLNNSLNPKNSSLNTNKKAEKQYSKEVEEDIRVILEREKTKRHEHTIMAIMCIVILFFAFLMMCVVAYTKQ